ncbi:nicotinate-nucleotide adenylyltransferase [Seonamhaeicola sediminis]|uniref:Nicotinate-nucleotide adenylyltransferase n=1 Tax=Seonamhaeicola sediminis TaxID=2528206 RepID=A0A562YEJ5_9FLAO|nr:nicotinate-nucleotide adenylyltransferase [Seonamhaeicola sediminis]TWO33067.1 nicotinate-nucleotide adenylyltransferase [Seonamhaeicola sediminis]
MKRILLASLITILSLQVNAQTIELPDTVISLNSSYLNAIDSENVPQRVKKLEEAVINYNNNAISELYDNKKDTYIVSFNLPEGKIIAAINKKGKIIRTLEKYNNVRLPLEVMQAISNRFPNWGIIEDIYLIKYHCNTNNLKKEYKVKIKNEDQILTIKTNEKGDFI